MKEKIESMKAPAAIGPYSQAVNNGGLVFVSGQSILAEVGYDMDRILKTTVYLQDMNDFSAMNQVYETYFTAPYPARAAFQVAKLPKGAKVEIEAVAM